MRFGYAANRFGQVTGAALAVLFAVSCNGGTSRPTTEVAAVTPGVAPPADVVKPDYTNISMRAQGQRVPVIMYHDVIESRTREAQWFDCTTEEFEAQMQWLIQEGVTPISLDELYKHLTKGDAVPEKSVVLTFDDN